MKRLLEHEWARPRRAGGLAVVVLIAVTAALGGCAASRPASPSPVGVSTTGTTVAEPARQAQTPAPALPFKGKLVDGDPDELPPVVRAALATNAAVSFAYREQLTHDEYHIPLLLSALDPVTYFGAPLGDYGVTAVATLTITRGDTLLGNYSAKAHASKSYSIYSEPTHREVEEAARAAVRDKIDERLYHDAARVAGLIDAPPQATSAAGVR
ncbi:MAG: hypothetical protein ACREQD_09550 [Candidatus Binataceae bacterium]